ncbi:hypothetical protein [Desulfopila inferna]|uniref:hypothetical protein n=1 Tax=Desulfopila inferna TaxID=468528 RepID=UPI001963E65F|nr:hypothetical protein [Desulfopila inferna]MBM9603082.1 hypothetical protein [Desulfopila inferna]
MSGIWESITAAIDSTHLLDQIREVDAAGLFSNPWFLVPFILLAGYMIYKQSWRDMALIGIFMGVWWVSGTPYMQTLVDGDELKVEKILPVVFGGGITLGVVIYLLLGRS